jgi:HAD superfamily hydrolase (TIGR01459 family)
MSASTQIAFLEGIEAIADRYDGFIIDLWGVIHDGTTLYPGVLRALTALQRRGRQVCFLSNAPRRLAAAMAKLQALGVDRRLYHAIHTSGEAAYEALLYRNDPWHAKLGNRLLHLGPPRDADIYQDTPGLIRVERPDQADFILNTGPDDDDETIEDYAALLRQCQGLGLPMLCANPDRTVMAGGRAVICAGALAAYYEALGGDVRAHGKPYAAVYQRCQSLFGIDEKSRLCAIGDNMATDIAGAAGFGIDSILVTGGVHLAELGGVWGGRPDQRTVARLLQSSAFLPTWIMPRFSDR